MMVEWLFGMHDDQRSKGALARLLSVEVQITTYSSNPDWSIRAFWPLMDLVEKAQTVPQSMSISVVLARHVTMQ